MPNQQLIQLAREYCIYYHDKQFRKGSNQPYHTHPVAVARILDRYGYSDTVTQCITLLHDTVEDTELSMREIDERFGYEIANGVFILSKNTINAETVDSISRALSIDASTFSNEQLYKARLSFARRRIRRAKIADMIHNTQDLPSLKPEGIERKIRDAEEFYIPVGREIAPLMVQELEQNLANYRRMCELRP